MNQVVRFLVVVCALGSVIACDPVLTSTNSNATDEPPVLTPVDPPVVEPPEPDPEPEPDPNESEPLSFLASVGASNTQISFPEVAGDYEFYRSRESDCDLENYTACDFGQLDIVNAAGSSVIDTAFTLTAPGFYQLVEEPNTSPVTLHSVNRFSGVAGHQVVNYRRSLWVLGGRSAARGEHAEVWVSQFDGENWLSVGDAAFGARVNHQAVVINLRMWLFGGLRAGQPLNDVWSSNDGINWVQESTSYPAGRTRQVVEESRRLLMFGHALNDGDAAGPIQVWESERGREWQSLGQASAVRLQSGFKAVVRDGTFWLFGIGSSNTSEVWSSANGVDWTRITGNADFGPRKEQAVAVYNNNFFVSGGAAPSGSFSDVWRSTDGANWTRVRISRPDLVFPGREAHQSLAFEGRLWTIGGDNAGDRGLLNGVWSSADGSNWLAVGSDTPAPAKRVNPQAMTLGNSVIQFGQRFDTATAQLVEDLNRSDDLLNWQALNITPATVAQRSFASKAAFNNRVWMIGGRDDADFPDDLWASDDGQSWQQVSPDIGFDVPVSNNLLSFQQRLWLVGAKGRRDIWATADGTSWSRQVPLGDFPERICYSLEHQNELWLFGLEDIADDSELAAWSSADGINWTRNAAVLNRVSTADELVSFNGRMLLFLADDPSMAGSPLALWSLTPGGNWQQDIASLPFPYHPDNRAVVVDGVLQVFAQTADGKNKTWSSVDGVDWRLGYRGTIGFDDVPAETL